MKREKRAKDTYKGTVALRTIVDILFLLLFIGLTAAGIIQIWFALFAAGLLVSTIAGRFYCGWACPMHTLMRILPLPGRISPPRFLSGPAARYGVLVLFLAAAVSQQILGLQAPVLPILAGIAVLITLFFQENWWHSVLCPFGTLLDGASSRAKFGLFVDPERCTGCGICEKACPADSIHPAAGRHVSGKHAPERRTAVRAIDTSKCLSCFSCAKACPLDVIHYGVLR
ncbi:MAG: 4Fe-4S binding protein [Spirochaetia bacterium]